LSLILGVTAARNLAERIFVIENVHQDESEMNNVIFVSYTDQQWGGYIIHLAVGLYFQNGPALATCWEVILSLEIAVYILTDLEIFFFFSC